MSEKIMFYDGLFDEIAKKYTDHKSKRTKIGIVITHEELRALKSREQVLQQELGLTKLRLEQTDSSFKQADEAHSKVEAMYFESERKCKALLEANKDLEAKNKIFRVAELIEVGTLREKNKTLLEALKEIELESSKKFETEDKFCISPSDYRINKIANDAIGIYCDG